MALWVHSRPSGDRKLGQVEIAVPAWRDPMRYLWILGAIVPGLAGLSWLTVQLTGLGVFWWWGLFLAFVVVPALDHLYRPDVDNPPERVLAWLETDRYYRWVTYLFLPSQYLSLVFACWLWAGGGWLTMSAVDKAGLMVSMGIAGGCAINVAHELGHKRTELEKRLSKAALAPTFYGHFFVEHNRGHHVRVATAGDSASARMGESVYRFVPRSVLGGLRSAWQLEADRLNRCGRSRWSLRNDLLNAWMLSAVLYVVLVVWFGMVVLPWLIGQAVIGIYLLETINYTEHYGLRRRKLPNGRYERINAAHSWNSNTVVVNAFLFHLQRHSDHHTHPLRRYQALSCADGAPQLPAGYGTMILLALLPSLWRRVMDPRVLTHYGGDMRRTALSPRREKEFASGELAMPAARVPNFPRSLTP